MADLETKNVAIKETLAQAQCVINLFRGNMETSMEYLQTQRVATSVNPSTVVVTNVIVATTTADVVTSIETPIKTVVLANVNQHMFTFASNRLVASYPLGIPPSFASQFANGGAFVPHQALTSPTTVGNSTFPWDVPMVQTPQMVGASNPENTQGQIHAETPNEDVEY